MSWLLFLLVLAVHCFLKIHIWGSSIIPCWSQAQEEPLSVSSNFPFDFYTEFLRPYPPAFCPFLFIPSPLFSLGQLSLQGKQGYSHFAIKREWFLSLENQDFQFPLPNGQNDVQRLKQYRSHHMEGKSGPLRRKTAPEKVWFQSQKSLSLSSIPNTSSSYWLKPIIPSSVSFLQLKPNKGFTLLKCKFPLQRL